MRAGTLDGVMVNVDSGYDIGAHKAAPHILLSKELWLGHLYLLVMNRETWNGLAEEDRQAVGRAARTAYEVLGALMERSFDAQVETLRKEGANVRILEPAEVRRWAAATRYAEAQAAWVAQQAGKGLPDAGAVVGKIGGLLRPAATPKADLRR